MGRVPRITLGNMVYHVINRANGMLRFFETAKDYQAFESILAEAKDKFSMRILSYCLMPNHWHLVLYPQQDNDLSLFMQWITLTHTQRLHKFHESAGRGHWYQGRFKSFPVQTDEYFLQLCKYVERNALRAGLVKRAEEWRWSSIWRREFGSITEKSLLSDWPIPPGSDYVYWLNMVQPKADIDAIHTSIVRGSPYGSPLWTRDIAIRLGIESTLTPRGRPKKGT